MNNGKIDYNVDMPTSVQKSINAIRIKAQTDRVKMETANMMGAKDCIDLSDNIEKNNEAYSIHGIIYTIICQVLNLSNVNTSGSASIHYLLEIVILHNSND